VKELSGKNIWREVLTTTFLSCNFITTSSFLRGLGGLPFLYFSIIYIMALSKSWTHEVQVRARASWIRNLIMWYSNENKWLSLWPQESSLRLLKMRDMKISLIHERETYLSLLFSFRILFHPQHYVLQSLAFWIGTSSLLFLELSCLAVDLVVFALGADVLRSKWVPALLTARFPIANTVYRRHIQHAILYALCTWHGDMRATSWLSWVVVAMGFALLLLCLMRGTSGRWGCLSIVIIIHVHFDTFK
jgi:hypothetical protein